MNLKTKNNGSFITLFWQNDSLLGGDVCLLSFISEGQDFSSLQQILPSVFGHHQFGFAIGESLLFYDRNG